MIQKDNEKFTLFIRGIALLKWMKDSVQVFNFYFNDFHWKNLRISSQKKSKGC